MPATTPMPTKNPGDVLTSSLWNSYLRDNIDKLLTRGHRVLTVAQFTALASFEGTKGSVPPDEVYLEVDATNGIQWHLAYESGEATYKWRYLGGPPLYAEVQTAETTVSGTYAALTTAGPSIPVPRGGDYDVRLGGRINVGGNIGAWMSYDIGATTAVDADSVDLQGPAASTAGSVSRLRRKPALTAVTLTAKYRTTITADFKNRWIAITPARLV